MLGCSTKHETMITSAPCCLPFFHLIWGCRLHHNLVVFRELDRQARAAEKGFVHNSSSAAKRQRAQMFAAWLVQQYGREQLSAGAGVLDVAGKQRGVTH